MDDINVKIDSTQSIGFFSRLQGQSITSKEPPKPVPITSKEPPKPIPIPITSKLIEIPVEAPVVEAPVVEAPVETPVEAPVVEAPVVEAPVVEAPVVETPVETPVEAVETPVETPIIETPVEAPVETPVEAPVVEAPVVETPVETPVEAVETPVETPIIETPVEAPVETPVEAPVVEAPVETPVEASIEFINKLNATPKNIGHNKFQQRIEELEGVINNYKTTQQQSELKINLFKNTITTLQSQLQEKSAQISRLETRHIDPQYEKQISDLKGSLNEKNDVIGVLRGNLSTSEKELEFFDKKCNDLIKQRDETLQQIDDIKKRYSALENNHQRQAIQLQVSGESILKLENKLNLEENIRRNLENEIESMKTELTNYRTDIKNVTIERDNEISRLQNELKSKDIIVEMEEIKPAQSVTYVTGNVQINRRINRKLPKKRKPTITN